ncbi:uncharacterized protein CDV56_107371 [Aspergillus thermomutatus]|uniref:BHLH domain-containing protein n=1 Tax=Aspergillus thermomutatus TaxID=41047 RepID=A0A397GQI1_ASPTH|nr:uncharacterized protein CDV56_107371 [Aspergillus thermomutatus]RHZ53272.1 hypothetical protein CDV56_107371 [Aspergillus thermomutatus]
MTYYSKARAPTFWPLQSNSLQQSCGMAAYPGILPVPDDMASVDVFQLRSMLPNPVPPNSTSDMVLDPEDIFPTFSSDFRDPAVSSDLLLSNNPTTAPCTSPPWSSQDHLSPSPSSTPTLKKSGTSSADSQTTKGRKAAKRASHNIIEKRYRTNMNAKFTTLEKVITSCRHQQKVPANRSCSMKKCEILTNAIKCIQSLEDRNAALCEDVAFLREQHRLLGAV